MAKAKGDREARARGWVARKPSRHMPPPESELWPEHCRGVNWSWDAARYYVDRCQLCAYSCQPSEGRRQLDRLAGLPTFLVCTNHPDSPGRLRDVRPTQMCRNFKERQWMRERPRKAQRDWDTYESDDRIRRIPLAQGLFAIVDAADYEELSKHKWCAVRRGGNVYAYSRIDGKNVSMHRFIMKAPKGSIVDHIRHNGADNRRCNLRICTATNGWQG